MFLSIFIMLEVYHEELAKANQHPWLQFSHSLTFFYYFVPTYYFWTLPVKIHLHSIKSLHCCVFDTNIIRFLAFFQAATDDHTSHSWYVHQALCVHTKQLFILYSEHPCSICHNLLNNYMQSAHLICCVYMYCTTQSGYEPFVFGISFSSGARNIPYLLAHLDGQYKKMSKAVSK